ncbi:hypothetical protein HMPREF9318_01366 [Streptococcus urinalis FB127-CNA-2]|uniref:B-block binding subunit of TFIIIC n=1 Tax=Streptococcus urinalis 2285-97 TaxID=764291 RepID=G5KD27_9STRE|nr:MarR family transcriptional regulator [Streptococcus urinalis]EHJ56959.1 B-block binding subunit of TFIIIC [Streptococcus urinalis 2285-97]EKS19290.1 hypothetical protein HMPREF9318_01366 [Streptococcus urinalis FB127-CNA-2]VEF31421.1 MarR family transcriptional regulator [Streptococcus urinalis]
METHKIGILIKMASVEFEKDAATILKHYDLTPSQFKILRYVNHFKEKKIRQIDIEHTFNMSNPTVTGILQNLEKKEYIKRLPNPEDKRSKVIILSQKLKDQKLNFERISQEINNTFTKNLDSEQSQLLADLLHELLDGRQKCPIKGLNNSK